MKVTNQKNLATSNLQGPKKAGTSAVEKSVKGTSSAIADLADAGGAGSSRVELSPRAREMQKANEVARSGSDVDEAKVAHFQSLIDKGMYKPDAGKIADRMVDEHVSNLLSGQLED